MLGNFELVARLVLAAALGSVIGIERERLSWAAGLRTHMLVCVGSALIMIVSAFGFADVLGAKNVVLDPSRMAAQVVSGIGFLGAGSILMRGEIVRGLTTAASLWSVASIATWRTVTLSARISSVPVMLSCSMTAPSSRTVMLPLGVRSATVIPEAASPVVSGRGKPARGSGPVVSSSLGAELSPLLGVGSSTSGVGPL